MYLFVDFMPLNFIVFIFSVLVVGFMRYDFKKVTGHEKIPVIKTFIRVSDNTNNVSHCKSGNQELAAWLRLFIAVCSSLNFFMIA